MQNKFISDIIMSVKILILILLICTLSIAKSLFLVAFITVFSLIILILLGRNVNKNVDFLKKILIWLLFIVIMYIIVCKSITGLFIFVYKIALSTVLIDTLISSSSFNEIHSGIYAILGPLKKFNIDIDKKSFNVALDIIFLHEFLYSSDKIAKIQLMRNKRSYSIKYFIFPRLLTSIDYVKKFENSLQLKFYTVKCEKINFKSIFLLIIFISLFILAVFKEVIL